jgi:pyruvate/2-oxoglutarate dehydrogenase complex dihydrolipoamide acyltransferase (E2) component
VLQLKLVFDHRPLNGAHAAAFLLAVKSSLETVDLTALVR